MVELEINFLAASFSFTSSPEERREREREKTSIWDKFSIYNVTVSIGIVNEVLIFTP